MRQIARTLGINRKSVARHLAALSSKGASAAEAPIDEALTGPDDSKGAKAPTGSKFLESGHSASKIESTSASLSRSECRLFRDLIVAKIERGLSAQRIYQDLVTDHGFNAKYHSVRRYVASLTQSKVLPVRRIEVDAGHEMQIDYGQGARCLDHTGKLRKTYVFRLVLSHSRKGYTEAVTRLTTESLIRSLENAFRALGGVPKIVVFDNAPSAVKQADWYDPELNPKIIAFCKHYNIAFLPTRPGTPEHKGKVERGVDYVQENAIKGMTFESLALQNQHLLQWEKNVADTRIHGTTKKHVGKQFIEVEKATLGPLPSEPFPIYDEGIRKVSRDGHVEVKGSFYSAPPEYLGCEVWMRWNDRVVRMLNHRQEQIALHPRMEKGKFSTLSEHIAPSKINGIERGARHLMQKVRLIGPNTTRWAEEAINERGVHSMRTIQGVLGLTRKYKSAAIEDASDTAWRSGSFTYRTIRRLLEHRGAKQETMEFMDEHPVIRSILEYDEFFKRALARG
ncbi:Integrase core domain protein [Pirellula sp. SH-Sr6A]|nr:Integrase core domain protein [Pirellula sp. SH-Sr6A]